MTEHSSGNQKNDVLEWLGHNWKWLVPAVIGFVVVSILIAAMFVSYIFGLIKSSDVYVEAFARARNSTEVIERLGTPVEDGFIVSGNISVTGSSGEADLFIPISGPYGSGVIHAVSEKRGGNWHFTSLYVKFKGSRHRIDLLSGKWY